MQSSSLNIWIQSFNPIKFLNPFYGKYLGILWFLLAHPSRRLKWAIVIVHCPSSVRPLSSSVNFDIFNFFSRTAWWILIGHGGPLLQETYFSDWKATVTNRMRSNDLEACGDEVLLIFGSIHNDSEVNILTRFGRLFWLSHYNAISMGF